MMKMIAARLKRCTTTTKIMAEAGVPVASTMAEHREGPIAIPTNRRPTEESFTGRQRRREGNIPIVREKTRARDTLSVQSAIYAVEVAEATAVPASIVD